MSQNRLISIVLHIEINAYFCVWQGYKKYLTTIWKAAGFVGQTVEKVREKPSEEKKSVSGKSDELAACRKVIMTIS